MSVATSARHLTNDVRVSGDLSRWLILCGICILGLGLRLWGLTSESIWLDEASSLSIARMPVPDLVNYLAAQDVHPPLYFTLLHVWQNLGADAFTLRLLSVILGVLSLPVVYGLGRELLSWRAGIVGALLLAVSPLHIYYSQMVRMYVLLVLVVTLAFFALVRAIRTGRGLWWGAYVIAAALSVYTHTFAWVALPAHNMLVLFLVLRERPAQRQLRAWLLANLIVALLALPWLPALVAQQSGEGPGWLRDADAPAVTAFISTIGKFTLGETVGALPRTLRMVGYALCGLLLASAVLERRPGFPYVRPTRRLGTWICLLYLAVPLIGVWLLSQIRPVYVTRYLLPFVVPYLLALAAGIASLRPAVARYGAALALMAIMGIGVWMQVDTLQVDDWRAAADYVVARSQPGDTVIFSPAWYEAPFEFYAQGRVPGLTASRDVLADPQQACQLAAAIPGRLWMVKPYAHHWSDPEDRLSLCLGAARSSLDVYRFNRSDGAIVLYTAP